MKQCKLVAGYRNISFKSHIFGYPIIEAHSFTEILLCLYAILSNGNYL